MPDYRKQIQLQASPGIYYQGDQWLGETSSGNIAVHLGELGNQTDAMNGMDNQDYGEQNTYGIGKDDGRPERPEMKWYWTLPFFKDYYADQLAKYQTDYDYWSMMDERQYNSMEQQMNRMKEAGLNPNLAYSQGGYSAGGRSEAQVQDIKSNGSIDQIIKMLTMVAQLNNLKSVTNLNNARAVSEAERPFLLKQQGLGAMYDKYWKEDTWEVRSDQEKWKSYASYLDYNVRRNNWELEVDANRALLNKSINEAEMVRIDRALKDFGLDATTSEFLKLKVIEGLNNGLSHRQIAKRLEATMIAMGLAEKASDVIRVFTGSMKVKK